MTNIVPAVIPESFEHLREEVEKVKDLEPLVQVDITDGIFVRGKTWPYRGDGGEYEKLVREEIGLPFWEDIEYEFHLMIENPEKTVADWIRVGASGIVVQIEGIKDFEKGMEVIIDICKASEVHLGLSLKPSTDIAKLAPYIGSIDSIQCMGSNDLGHHGATLDESVFEKIKQLRKLYPDMPIAIDIGVNEDTVQKFIDVGATKLISGGAIFGLE